MADAAPPRCLIVDDEEAFRALLTAILEDAGYACWTAADVAGARALLAAEPVGCVLLDVSLPGGGLRFLEELRRDRPAVAVVMVSGHDDPRVAHAALEAGASGYVLKPFAAAAVREAVRSALDGSAS